MGQVAGFGIEVLLSAVLREQLLGGGLAFHSDLTCDLKSVVNRSGKII